MKKKLGLSLLLINSVSAEQDQYFFSSELLKEQYQDIVINGVVVNHGIRDCESRYQAIKKSLDLYKRPITVLDIGASQGYFSFRIAHDYVSTCIMIEGGYDNTWKTGSLLLELCKLNDTLHNVILLEKRITPEELEKLGACEHFDVVLALNVIHHFGDQWQRTADAILNLGDTVIIESPSKTDSIAQKNTHIAALENHLLKKNGKIILEVPRHTDPKSKGKLYWFEQNKTFLTRPYWIIKSNNYYKNNYIVESNYLEKKLIKKISKQIHDWKMGINLLTFLMLNGTYPSREKIKKNVLELEKQVSSDFILWNMIIQGDNLQLIDLDDSRRDLDKNAGLEFTLHMLEQKSPEEVLSWYKENFPLLLKAHNLYFSGWQGYDF